MVPKNARHGTRQDRFDIAESDKYVARNDLSGREIDFGDITAGGTQVAFGANPGPPQANGLSEIAKGSQIGGALSRPNRVGIDASAKTEASSRGPIARSAGIFQN